MGLRLLFAAVACMSVGLTGCEEEQEVYDVYDYDQLIAYVYEKDDARELFRTDSLIPNNVYTKPENDTVFRDFVDSVVRSFHITTTPSNIEKEFETFGITDDAEVVVEDTFYVRTQRVHGVDTSYADSTQKRGLTRIGYFLRLGNPTQPYSGWLLHAYNGGSPRGQAALEIEREDGSIFRGDGFNFEDFRYIQYTYVYTDDDFYVDTSVGRSAYEYLVVDNIPKVSPRDTLIWLGYQNDQQSAYQLMTVETIDGFVQKRMHRPEPSRYVDTMVVSAGSIRRWNVVLLQEFTVSGRVGRLWCVPYAIPMR